MVYKIIFNDEKLLTKDLSKIPKKNIDLIFQKLGLLSEMGLKNNIQIKKLNNYHISDYRLRVGDFRILFNIDSIKNEIIIFRILHRSKLY